MKLKKESLETLCKKIYDGSYLEYDIEGSKFLDDDNVVLSVFFDYLKNLQLEAKIAVLEYLGIKDAKYAKGSFEQDSSLYFYIENNVSIKKIKKFLKERIATNYHKHEFDFDKKIKFYYIMKKVAEASTVLSGCKKKTKVSVVPAREVLFMFESQASIDNGYDSSFIGDYFALSIEKLNEIMNDPEKIKTYIEAVVAESKRLSGIQHRDLGKFLD